MTTIRLLANGEVLEVQVVSFDEVKISPHKFIMQEWGFYWRVSDCEELVAPSEEASRHKLD